MSQKPLSVLHSKFGRTEKVFEEEFTFKDIYVPLEVKPVKQDSSEVELYARAENIEHWAKKLLLDDERQNQEVLFIQGGPGRGKSVFCRMFADWVRENLHPAWTPILIRLRDIQIFADNLDDTLKKALNAWNFSKNPSWLNDPNTRFLFLLDGFDELLLERGVNKNLKQFLNQVSLFQKQCQQNEYRGHRVLITGRPLTLYGIEQRMPTNLAKVGIIPMDAPIQDKWFEKWQNLADKNPELGKEKTETFKAFLHNCPSEVQELAKEPLLLYMLAGMHRDNKDKLEKLKSDMPQATKKGGAKILIYQEAIKWVLTKQRSENGRNLNLNIGETEGLRSLLAEAGLSVVQSGREYTSISHIQNRLEEKGDKEAQAIIERAGKQSANQDSEDKGLKIPLAVFYIKSVPGADNSVEFVHKSFGEFFCAERMVKSFVEWTKQRGTNPKTTEELDYKIYDLLGYGHLTPEIMEYVMALLEQADSDKKIDLVILSERLNNVYLRWSKGEFIEATVETLPQKKARQLEKNKISRGQRTVDIFTGLNLLILLLELHRYGQREENKHLKDKLTFHPCGQPETENFDETRLLTIIDYSKCLAAHTFNTKLGQWLSGADLRGADLRGAILSKADIRGAILSGAILREAILSGAILREANLSGAILSGAILSKADLSKADLSEADLKEADIRGAKLSGAKLREAKLRRAKLSGAKLREAKLRRANLREAKLSGADLSGENLSEADIRWADLREAKLSGADLSGAKLRGAKLRRANLSGANLREAKLSEADLSGAKLSEAILRWADFREADLSGADLSGADLSGAKNLDEAIGIE